MANSSNRAGVADSAAEWTPLTTDIQIAKSELRAPEGVHLPEERSLPHAAEHLCGA
jgi:hypothetical protein